MKRHKLTVDFVAAVSGATPFTVRYCIREGIFPFGEFASAFLLDGNQRYQYVISPEKLREHFPFTDDDVQEFYEGAGA